MFKRSGIPDGCNISIGLLASLCGLVVSELSLKFVRFGHRIVILFFHWFCSTQSSSVITSVISAPTSAVGEGVPGGTGTQGGNAGHKPTLTSDGCLEERRPQKEGEGIE